MSRFMGVGCIIALLLVAGCSPDLLRVPFLGQARPQRIVTGSVVEVSCRLQEALSGAGISVLSKLQGDDLRLAGQTKTGKVFCFHLRKEQTPGAQKTRIILQWDREPDEDFWRTIVQPLAVTVRAEE